MGTSSNSDKQHEANLKEQPLTRGMLVEMEEEIEYGSIEVKKVNGRIADIVVKQHFKPID